MGQDRTNAARRADRAGGACLAAAAVVVALVGAVPYAGSPNDGSRLATVEALVDYHTFAIDDSIYVRTPPKTWPRERLPYPPHWPVLTDTGTVDKLRIDGRFYSDKPPAPASRSAPDACSMA